MRAVTRNKLLNLLTSCGPAQKMDRALYPKAPPFAASLMTQRIIPINLVFAILVWPALVHADLQAEQRLIDTWRGIDDLPGELVDLEATGDTFVAIHIPQRSKTPLGAVVLLHDAGTHADSHEVIRPLRVGLAPAGWETLAIQLPLLAPGGGAWQDNGATIVARLQAALAWFQDRQQRNQVVLALGETGPIALRFAAAQGQRELQALILVSVPDDLTDDADRDALAQLERPLLDLFAERDLASVTANADARAAAARSAGLDAYAQRRISGATAGFRGLDAELLATVRSWLRAHAAGNTTR